jgi:ssDNA-binding Zn-finger/Zn-ribbon topoisomerase 1
MSRDFKTPIACPHCGKPLSIVQMKYTKVLEWTVEENSEGRFVDNGQVATDVSCYNCGQKIGQSDANGEWGLFPAIENER